MTLGEAIRHYREKNSISQADLAKELGISQMGVSRLEANQDIRMTKALADRIVGLLGEDLVYAIDDESKNLLQTKKLFKMVCDKRPITDCRQIQRECAAALAAVTRSWSREVVVQRQGIESLECTNDEKRWYLDICLNREFGSTLRQRLAEGIGLAAMSPSINKYSMIRCVGEATEPEASEAVTTEPGPFGAINCWDNLNFDVSILYFDLQKKKFIAEDDICVHYDGRGFFDLAVPDRAEAAATAYSRWKTSMK